MASRRWYEMKVWVERQGSGFGVNGLQSAEWIFPNVTQRMMVLMLQVAVAIADP